MPDGPEFVAVSSKPVYPRVELEQSSRMLESFSGHRRAQVGMPRSCYQSRLLRRDPDLGDSGGRLKTKELYVR